MANRFLEPFSYFTPYLHFDTGLTVPQAAQAAAAAGSVGSVGTVGAVPQQPVAHQQATHVQHQQHNQPAIGYQNPYYNHFMTQNLNRLVKNTVRVAKPTTT